jgi:hypothetical protein
LDEDRVRRCLSLPKKDMGADSGAGKMAFGPT